MAEAGEELPRPPGGLGPLAEARGGQLVTEGDVLGDAEPGDQVQLLVDGGDPESQRRDGRGQCDDLVVPAKGARVGLMDPREDLDESGLSGAVLPKESVHLTGHDVQIDAVQRLDAGVVLLHPDRLEGQLPYRQLMSLLFDIVCGHHGARPPCAQAVVVEKRREGGYVAPSSAADRVQLRPGCGSSTLLI